MTFREMLIEDLDQVMEIETDLHAMDKGGNVHFPDKRGHHVLRSRRKGQDPWLLQHADSAGRG